MTQYYHNSRHDSQDDSTRLPIHSCMYITYFMLISHSCNCNSEKLPVIKKNQNLPFSITLPHLCRLHESKAEREKGEKTITIKTDHTCFVPQIFFLFYHIYRMAKHIGMLLFSYNLRFFILFKEDVNDFKFFYKSGKGRKNEIVL